MKVLFVDTNLFIQCLDLKELPWAEVSKGADLRLVVSRPVMKEIDRLKRDTSSRRAKRARKTTSMLREIIQSPAHEIALRESSPRVLVSTWHVPGNIDGLNENLDPLWSDDAIVAEALRYQSAFPSEEVGILSDDTNQLLTAQSCALPYLEIPDHWFLPHEPDSRDKTIASLRERIGLLESTTPVFALQLLSESETECTQIEFTLEDFPGLTEPETAELMREVQHLHPICTDFANVLATQGLGGLSTLSAGKAATAMFDMHRQYQLPSEAEVMEYKQTLYPDWLRSVESFLDLLPESLQRPSRRRLLTVSLSNIGTVPAEHLFYEFQLSGGFLFVPPWYMESIREGPELPRIPTPPIPPKGKFVSLYDTFADIVNRGFPTTTFERPPSLGSSFPIYTPPRDRHGFYWRPDRPDQETDTWGFECEEFRHRVPPKRIKIVIVAPDGKIATGGSLKCTVSARNLPTPVERTFPIKLASTLRDTFSNAKLCISHAGQA